MRKYRQTYPHAKPARRQAWERTADVLLAIAIALGMADLLVSWWSA